MCTQCTCDKKTAETLEILETVRFLLLSGQEGQALGELDRAIAACQGGHQ